jgi:hypothetical protein
MSETIEAQVEALDRLTDVIARELRDKFSPAVAEEIAFHVREIAPEVSDLAVSLRAIAETGRVVESDLTKLSYFAVHWMYHLEAIVHLFEKRSCSESEGVTEQG